VPLRVITETRVHNKHLQCHSTDSYNTLMQTHLSDLLLIPCFIPPLCRGTSQRWG
jgi:hypothetical protein